MFGKIVDLIVKWICGGSREEKEQRRRSCDKMYFERELRLNVNDGARDERSAQKVEGRKNDEGAGAKKYSGIFGAFHYMNTRAEEVNFGSGVTHEWVRGISIRVKDFCSRPIMLVLLVSLPFLYMVSPKALILVPFLVVLGAVALVVQSFLPVYIGLDFSLMGAVLGSVLFHPWIGVLIVLCTYVVAVMFPNGNQDALEYERIVLFSFLALVIPYIPIADVMIKCVVDTYIGEFMDMFWHK